MDLFRLILAFARLWGIANIFGGIGLILVGTPSLLAEPDTIPALLDPGHSLVIYGIMSLATGIPLIVFSRWIAAFACKFPR